MAENDKPHVYVPPGEAPPASWRSELEEGTGAEAAAGQEVEVHSVGVAWSTRQQFDASWTGATRSGSASARAK